MKTFPKHIVAFIFLFLGSFAVQSQVCDILEPICTSQDGLNNTASDPSPIPINGPCTNIDGDRVAWYFILIDEVSTFTFQIEPTTPNDYDFAVWLNADCDNMGTPDRINYSGTPGNTGLSTTSTNNCQGAGGSPQSSPINVVPGDEIIIAVDRFSASFNMFDLTFGEPSALDCSVVGSQLCEGDTETLDATDPLATNYQWSFDDGMGGGPVVIFNGPGFNTIDVMDTGFYEVIISLPSGATNTEQFDVVFNPFPVIANPGNQIACDSFTLPDIATLVTDAYAPEYRTASQAMGGGTAIANNSTITTTQDIWIFDTSPIPSNCSDEEMFTVTINQTPTGTNATEDICTGTALAHDLNGDVDIASTFSWSAADNPNVTGETTATSTASDITDTLTNTSTTDQDVIYTVTPTATGPGMCAGAPFTVTVTVSPEPVGTNATETSCSGIALAHDLTADVNIPSTFSWQAADNPNVTGETTATSTATSITDILTNVTTMPETVIYTVIPTGSGFTTNCVGAAFTVTVTVNPEPVGTDATEQVCEGTPLAHDLNADVNIPAMFSWLAADNPNITGETTVATTTDNITDTLINTGTAIETVIYTITPTSDPLGCVGDTFELVVTVFPQPVGTNATEDICSQDTLAHDLTADVDVASTFSWMAADNPNVTGETTTMATATDITDTLVNTSIADQDVVYTVTPTSTTAGMCPGAPFTVTVTVSPEPVGTNATETLCSDVALAHDLNADVNIPSTFSWLATDNPDVTGETTTPSTPTSITDVLNNVSGTPQIVVYTVTPTGSGFTSDCPGTPFTVTVTVNPEPVGTDATEQVCEGTALAHDLNGDVDIASTFSWSAADNTNITGETTTTTTTDLITDTLINTGTAIETVTYTITPTSDPLGCVGETFELVVTVFPQPIGTDATEDVCSQDTLAHDLTMDVDVASTFSWIATDNPNVSGETTTVTTTSDITDTLVNISLTDQDVVYTVTPTSTSVGMCPGAPFTVTITVSPEPVGTNATETLCSDIALAHDLTADVGIPSTFSWLAIDNPDVTGETTVANTATTITDVLNNVSGLAQTVIYTVTPTGTGFTSDCPGTPFTVTVTVNPEPVGDGIASNQEICTTETLNIDLDPTVTLPSTFSWEAVDNPNVTGETLAPGNPTSIIDDTLTNTTTVDTTVEYIITPTSTADGCTGDPYSIFVTVVATPILDPIADQNECDTFTFPEITQMGAARPNAYFATNPDGTGDTYTQGQTITYFDFFPNQYPVTIYTYEVTTGTAACESPQNSFALTIVRSPEATTPADYPLCDDNNDGIELYDLTSRNAEVLGALDPANHDIIWFDNVADANDQTAVSTIPDETMHPFAADFPITTPPTQVVFARVTEQSSGVDCFSVVPLTLVLNPDPVLFDDMATFEVCDDNVPDGIVMVDLSINDQNIAGPNTPADFTVSYHNTPQDAIDGVAGVDKFNYQTLPPPYPYTLYTRVTNNITGCHDEGEIAITVLQAPSVFAPTPYELCDPDNDDSTTFMLSSKNDEIRAGNPTLVITYYRTQAEAEADPPNVTNALDQNIYTNNSNPETVWARVENAGGCATVVPVELIVLDTPMPNDTPDDYALCDFDGDGLEVFDLTSREMDVLGGL
ncbi:hypothetical protein EAX61_16065, partial [Dokdonia sinensis]